MAYDPPLPDPSANSQARMVYFNGNGKKPKPNFEVNKSVGYTETDLTDTGNNAEQLLSISKTASTSATKSSDPKEVVVTNTSNKPAIVFSNYKYSAVDDGATDGTYALQTIVLPGESISPPMRGVINTDSDAYNQPLVNNALTNQVPDSNMHTDSDADLDSATADGVVNHISATTVYLEPYTSAANCTANLFRVGDLIRIRNEIMEVTAIGSKAALATNTLTVKRAVHGSVATTDNANEDAVSFAFFNAYHDFDAKQDNGQSLTVQTNGNGKFKCTNFFGYGRATTIAGAGITPGSFAIKFYESGYQSLGMTNASYSTESGLAASTEYKFNITVDAGAGGSAYANLAFTTSANNLKFGGRDGVLNKIQDALDDKYKATAGGNLLGRGVTVSIVDGDVRFTSNTRTSTSAILLAAPGSGTTPFGVGRIPAIGDVNAAVAAKLPDDVLYDRVTYASSPNLDVFSYDDGKGNIVGNVATGTINYETGAIDFTGPANANFVVSATYGGLLGGKQDSDNNSLIAIHGASLNPKCNATLKVEVF